MPLIFPDISGMQVTSAGQDRELSVIRVLARDLPDDYAVYHNVLYSTVHDAKQFCGEIDVIVLCPHGHLVLLEIKAGNVEFSDAGIHKDYADRKRDVLSQMRFQYGALRQRLKEERLQVQMLQYLVLPDMEVEQGTVTYPLAHIIDRRSMRFLGKIIRDGSQKLDKNNPDRFEALSHFLGNTFALAADPSARICALNQAVVQLSEGLATWGVRIHAPSGRYLVRATAGSGKTQLALRLLENASSQGQEMLYVCYNRALADHLRRCTQMPAHCIVTFHELALDILRRQFPDQASFDFTHPDIFQRAESAFCITDKPPSLKMLIIDEGQDFRPEWIQALLRQCVPDAQVYVLHDLAQNLYFHDNAVDASTECLSDAVEITCMENFRSPRSIVEVINALDLAGTAVEARCPHAGDIPGFHRWENTDSSGMDKLEGVVAQLIAEGLEPKDIALLSYAGRANSLLLRRKSIAGIPLRCFTGKFDEDREPIWSEGLLLAETIYRFKGQAAPVIVLCEVDFERLDAQSKNRLFVGMTRAQWRLEIVLSARAERALMTAITESDEM